MPEDKLKESTEDDLLADVFPGTEKALLPRQPYHWLSFLLPAYFDPGPFDPERKPNHNEDRG